MLNRSDADTSRFSTAPWYTPQVTSELSVLICGAGGIGSWTTLYLARLGLFNNISLVDFDIVDNVNYAGQLFFKEDVFFSKTYAVKNLVNSLAGATIHTYQEQLTTTHLDNKSIIISAVDNLTARRQMAEYFLVNCNKVNGPILFIDGRLIAEQFEIFFVTKDTIAKYIEHELPPEDSIPEQDCSFRQTSHIASMIGSVIVNLITNYVCNVNWKRTIRKVPYRTRYYAANLSINTSDE